MNSTLSPPSTLGLCWTDHYMMDAALAGLCVFSGVDDPAELTPEHLQAFQKWAEKAYFTKEMTGWISVVFTSNFLNPSFKPDKKRAVLGEIFTSYQRPNDLPERCAIFPHLQAQQRVARDLMPMLMGRGPMNFYPDGQSGLPLSGQAITALQGLSLAAPLVSGRAMILDADDKKLLLAVVREWQEPWLKRISLSSPTADKMPIWASERTRLMDAVRNILKRQPRCAKDSAKLPFVGGATIYHLTNSGQGPDANLYTLRPPALRFMELVAQAYPEAWEVLFKNHSSKRFKQDKKKDTKYGERNEIDEAMFALPDAAPWFLRRYLLPPFKWALRAAKAEAKAGKGGARKKTKKDDTAPKPVPLAGLWNITQIFLQEVVGMEQKRVEAIDALGQRLGKWIFDEGDKRLFRELYEVRGSGPMRRVLMKAMLAKAKDDADKGVKDGELIITPEQYLLIFMEAEEITRADFTLARDLLKMRVIEYLHAGNFFEENKGDPELQHTELPTDEGEQ